MYTRHKSQHKHGRYGHKVLRPCNSVTHGRKVHAHWLNIERPALDSDASSSPTLARDQRYLISKKKLKPCKVRQWDAGGENLQQSEYLGAHCVEST